MYPVRLGPTEALVPVGIILVVCSIVVVAMAVREISKAKTASDVRNPTTNLITSGIFGFSRNPTYLSMVMLCFGIAMIANSLPLLLAAVMVGSVLCLLVIRKEEAYLQRKSADQYTTYFQSVRRWF
tara:strand:+ start:969 stop:1346 length:378 start_codon:yes stop_codon:yes gene_type:complete